MWTGPWMCHVLRKKKKTMSLLRVYKHTHDKNYFLLINCMMPFTYTLFDILLKSLIRPCFWLSKKYHQVYRVTYSMKSWETLYFSIRSISSDTCFLLSSVAQLNSVSKNVTWLQCSSTNFESLSTSVLQSTRATTYQQQSFTICWFLYIHKHNDIVTFLRKQAWMLSLFACKLFIDYKHRELLKPPRLLLMPPRSWFAVTSFGILRAMSEYLK